MKPVGAGFRDHGEISAGVAALRRVVQRSLHDELLQGVGRRDSQARSGIGSRAGDDGAIQYNVVAGVSLAVHVEIEVTAAEIGVIRQIFHRSWRQAKDLRVVPRGQRQFAKLPLPDDASCVNRIGLNQRRSGRHSYGLCATRDAERGIHFGVLRDPDFDPIQHDTTEIPWHPPESCKFLEATRGRRSGRRRRWLISRFTPAAFVNVILAPATTAPLGSFTTPEIWPVVGDCALAHARKKHQTTQHN